jgi:hypothetical protein
MPTEFKVVVEGDLSEGAADAVTAAIQKAVLLELAGSRELEARPGSGQADAPALIFNRNIRGGKFIIARDVGTDL